MFTRRGTVRRRDGTAGRRVNIKFLFKKLYLEFHGILYSTAQYCTVMYSTVQYCAVLYSTVQYCTVLYSTAQYCTVLYITVQYCAVLYRIPWNSRYSFLNKNLMFTRRPAVPSRRRTVPRRVNI